MPSKADIWMPLYIGDYLADTSHLDAERHGCYLLWMMHYWRRGPLVNSIPDLLSIGRLRCADASSIAQALLREFFTLQKDGFWHQKRTDIEREKWQQKKVSAIERAKKAATGRWSKDASSITQAMLESCPSPSPLPLPIKEQQQKPSRGKRERQSPDPTKTDLAKARHAEFKSIVAEYWDSRNKGVQMPWDGREGKHLEMFLRAAPHITAEQFRGFLRNRYASEVNHGERPSQWIDWVTSYSAGPMDRFGKTMEVVNGQGRSGKSTSPARERVNGNRLAIAEALAARGVDGPWNAPRTDGAAVPESGFEGRTAGVPGRPGEDSPEILPPRS